MALGSHLFILVIADDLSASTANAEAQRSILRLSVAKVLAYAQRQAQIQQDPSLEYDFDLWQSAMLHLPLFGPAASSEETAEIQVRKGDLSAWKIVLEELFISKAKVVEEAQLSHFVEERAIACISQTADFEIIILKMFSRASSANEMVGTVECVRTQFTKVGDSKRQRSAAIPVRTKRLVFELNQPLQPASLHVLDGIDENTITASGDYLELHLDAPAD